MLEHPNKTRVYARGEIHDHRPGDKSHSLEIKPEVVALGKKMRKLVDYFGLSESDINQLIKNEFGEGVGYQTTRIFMDQLYGRGIFSTGTVIAFFCGYPSIRSLVLSK